LTALKSNSNVGGFCMTIGLIFLILMGIGKVLQNRFNQELNQHNKIFAYPYGEASLKIFKQVKDITLHTKHLLPCYHCWIFFIHRFGGDKNTHRHLIFFQ
jgi:hypothetical protein